MASRRVRHVDDVSALAARALGSGGVVVRPGVVEWDTSGRCQDPVTFTVEGRSAGPLRSKFQLNARPHMAFEGDGYDLAYGTRILFLDMSVPCRRCPPCLRERAKRWQRRASVEMARCEGRTWFGTLTMRPAEHWQMELRATAALEAKAVVWSTLSEGEQFKALANEGGKELTLWLKRVRKESGSQLRYMLVTEAHKSGRPHWHCLVHEARAHCPVRWATLKGQWAHGFTRFELVPAGDAGAARYVSKYLAKSALTRVRASQGYGVLTDIATELGECRVIARLPLRTGDGEAS